MAAPGTIALRRVAPDENRKPKAESWKLSGFPPLVDPHQDPSAIIHHHQATSTPARTHPTILKCRKKRAVTEFLPPPGGPQAHTKMTSMICRNCRVFRSYLRRNTSYSVSMKDEEDSLASFLRLRQLASVIVDGIKCTLYDPKHFTTSYRCTNSGIDPKAMKARKALNGRPTKIRTRTPPRYLSYPRNGGQVQIDPIIDRHRQHRRVALQLTFGDAARLPKWPLIYASNSHFPPAFVGSWKRQSRTASLGRFLIAWVWYVIVLKTRKPILSIRAPFERCRDGREFRCRDVPNSRESKYVLHLP